MSNASKYRTMQPKPGKHFPAEGYYYEKKYDGLRGLAGKDENGVELVSRGNKSITQAFPDLVAEFEKLPGTFVLDGEASILINGHPNLGAVLSRVKSLRPTRKNWIVSIDRPAVYFAFDLLEVDGVDIRHWPIEERKARLKKLLGKRRTHIRYVEHTRNGVKLFVEAYKANAEGIVCKKEGSAYYSKSSDKWLKFKTPGYVAMKKDDKEPHLLPPPPPRQTPRQSQCVQHALRGKTGQQWASFRHRPRLDTLCGQRLRPGPR